MQVKGQEPHCHNVVRKDKRDGTKVERSVRMRYGEIKAITYWSSVVMVLSLVNKPKFMQRITQGLLRSYGERSSTIPLRGSKATSEWWKKNPTPRMIILGCRNSQWATVMVADGNPSSMELRL